MKTKILIGLLIISFAAIGTATAGNIVNRGVLGAGDRGYGVWNQMILELEGGPREVQIGETITVVFSQKDLAQRVSGYQVSFAYPLHTLRYISHELNEVLYPLVFRNQVGVDGDGLGRMDFAAGRDLQYQQPTDADARLASITFEVTGRNSELLFHQNNPGGMRCLWAREGGGPGVYPWFTNFYGNRSVRGDFDVNGVVNLIDYYQALYVRDNDPIIRQGGRSPNDNVRSDITGNNGEPDGIVDEKDLRLIRRNMRRGGSSLIPVYDIVE